MFPASCQCNPLMEIVSSNIHRGECTATSDIEMIRYKQLANLRIDVRIGDVWAAYNIYATPIVPSPPSLPQ